MYSEQQKSRSKNLVGYWLKSYTTLCRIQHAYMNWAPDVKQYLKNVGNVVASRASKSKQNKLYLYSRAYKSGRKKWFDQWFLPDPCLNKQTDISNHDF